jgi:hypothetical protein
VGGKTNADRDGAWTSSTFSNNNATTGQVYAVDPETGLRPSWWAGRSRGDGDHQRVVDVTAYAGRVWICTTVDVTVAAHIYSIRPGVDTAWTTERTTVDLGRSRNSCNTTRSRCSISGSFTPRRPRRPGSPAVIEKRTAAGVWSDGTDLGRHREHELLRCVDRVERVALRHVRRACSVFTHRLEANVAVGTWISTRTWPCGLVTTPGASSRRRPVLYATCPPLVFTKAATGVWSNVWVSLNDASNTHGMLI